MSQEFRVASPQSDRFRVVAGLFYQRQSNEIFQDYQVKNLAPLLSVNGRPGTLWLTNQKRVDKDYAAFGELSYDIAPNLTLTAGGRAFIFDNSLIGFFGFGRNPAFIQGAAGNPPPNGAGSSRTGVAGCLTVEGITLREAQLQGRTTQLLPGVVPGTFCTNLGVASNGGVAPKSTEGSGFTHRVNLTWKPSDDVLLYGTWSRGFRPGGINRRATIAPYETDYLTNYELGFKTTLLNGKMRFNAAVYMQDWKTFQYAFLGENSFTQIQNGPDARIKGIEADLNVTPVDGLSLTIAGAYTDAKTRNNLCAIDDPSFTCTLAGSGGQINYVTTEKGSRLPITPKFKINATARYEFDAAGGKAHLQTNVSHQSSAASDIRNKQLRPLLDNTDPLVLANPLNFYNPAASIGRLKAFTTVDLAVGIDWSKVSAELFVANLFDERGQLSRYQQCGNCSQRTYIVPTSPRMIGVRLGTKF